MNADSKFSFEPPASLALKHNVTWILREPVLAVWQNPHDKSASFLGQPCPMNGSTNVTLWVGENQEEKLFISLLQLTISIRVSSRKKSFDMFMILPISDSLCMEDGGDFLSTLSINDVSPDVHACLEESQFDLSSRRRLLRVNFAPERPSQVLMKLRPENAKPITGTALHLMLLLESLSEALSFQAYLSYSTYAMESLKSFKIGLDGGICMPEVDLKASYAGVGGRLHNWSQYNSEHFSHNAEIATSSLKKRRHTSPTPPPRQKDFNHVADRLEIGPPPYLHNDKISPAGNLGGPKVVVSVQAPPYTCSDQASPPANLGALEATQSPQASPYAYGGRASSRGYHSGQPSSPRLQQHMSTLLACSQALEMSLANPAVSALQPSLSLVEPQVLVEASDCASPAFTLLDADEYVPVPETPFTVRIGSKSVTRHPSVASLAVQAENTGHNHESNAFDPTQTTGDTVLQQSMSSWILNMKTIDTHFYKVPRLHPVLLSLGEATAKSDKDTFIKAKAKGTTIVLARSAAAAAAAKRVPSRYGDDTPRPPRHHETSLLRELQELVSWMYTFHLDADAYMLPWLQQMSVWAVAWSRHIRNPQSAIFVAAAAAAAAAEDTAARIQRSFDQVEAECVAQFFVLLAGGGGGDRGGYPQGTR